MGGGGRCSIPLVRFGENQFIIDRFGTRLGYRERGLGSILQVRAKTAIAEILQEYPDARIVVVSAVKGNTMLECMKLGARGYVEKPLKFAEAIFVEDFKRSIEEAL